MWKRSFPFVCFLFCLRNNLQLLHCSSHSSQYINAHCEVCLCFVYRCSATTWSKLSAMSDPSALLRAHSGQRRARVRTYWRRRAHYIRSLLFYARNMEERKGKPRYTCHIIPERRLPFSICSTTACRSHQGRKEARVSCSCYCVETEREEGSISMLLLTPDIFIHLQMVCSHSCHGGSAAS